MFTDAILQQATVKPPNIVAYKNGLQFYEQGPKLAHILVNYQGWPLLLSMTEKRSLNGLVVTLTAEGPLYQYLLSKALQAVL